MMKRGKNYVGCHKEVGSQIWEEFDWKVKIEFFRALLVACVANVGETMVGLGIILIFCGAAEME